MNVSFVVCADKKNDHLEQLLIDIDHHINDERHRAELIVVYDNCVVMRDRDKLSVRTDRDFTTRAGWITKKKNVGVELSRYENVCVLHDYYRVPENFLDETEYCIGLYGGDIDDRVLIPKIETLEGHRHSDWIVDPLYMNEAISKDIDRWRSELMNVAPRENGPQFVCGLPYSVSNLRHIQYCSGGFIMTSRKTLAENPLSEDLAWGEAEDLEWSRRIIKNGVKFRLNPYVTLTVQKPNKWHVHEMPLSFVEHLQSMYARELNDKYVVL